MSSSPEKPIEPFITMKQAAVLVGQPYWKIQRLVKKDLIPHYSVFNSRKLLRLSELLTFIENSRHGGTP